MHFALSALLISAFLGQLLLGLVSVLRDLLAHDFGPPVMRPAGGDQPF